MPCLPAASGTLLYLQLPPVCPQVRDTDLSQHASTLAAMCRQERCTLEVVLAPASSTTPGTAYDARLQVGLRQDLLYVWHPVMMAVR
jgi:hypothetical protein